MNTASVKNQLERAALELGANAFGICRIDDLADTFHPEIREQVGKLSYAISIGIALQKAVMDTIVDRPNEIYKAHYRAANARLDDISFRLAQMIASMGHNAIPIPASKVVHRYPMTGHVSHREIAFKAGLGWWGKNNLLVHPTYGGRIRLASLLTDLELEPDEICTVDCGTCTACSRRCPAGAIGETPDDFQLEKCRDQVIYFSRDKNFGDLICGLCLNCCPGDTDGEKERQ